MTLELEIQDIKLNNPAKVPEGYKWTELGIIPEEWKVINLGKLLQVCYGKSQKEVVTDDGEYPILATGGEIGRAKAYLYDKPSVLIGRKGTIDKPQYIEKPFWTVDTLFYTKIIDVNPKILYYIATTIDWYSYNEASGVPSLNAKTIESIPITLPPLSEQNAIAAALSDVDALIEALEKLIAKKRDIKLATMQQLLTGKTRLPGFSGEWEEVRLGDLIDRIVGGGTPSRINPRFWGGDIPWATVKDFASFHPHGTQEYITKEGLNNSSSNLIPAGTLIISTRMAIGQAVIYKVDICINQDLKGLFLKHFVNTEYLYYWIQFHTDDINELSNGSTVKGLSITDLKAIPIKLASLEEQQAIATVLSDMDAEIEALEQRLEKTKQIKQGMMQQLLTGRVRLVQPNNVEIMQ